MPSIVRSTSGEIAVAILMSCAAAAVAAIVGFVGAIFLCAKLLSGESSESALILAPATALVLAVVVFVFSFRKITHYGEPHDG